MKVYLDSSVLVALLTIDPLTARADAFLRRATPILVLSDFATLEFASVMARRVRTNELTQHDACQVFSYLDIWARRATQRIETTSDDISRAETMLRRLDTTLRTQDAIHLTIARRAGAKLATFAMKMAAQFLGIDLGEA